MAPEQVIAAQPPEIKTRAMRIRAVGMFAIGIAMWIGVPAYCLIVPAVLKNDFGLAVALIVGMVGVLVTVVVLVRLLGKLNAAWQDEYEELNDRRAQKTPLEPMMVISVMIALVIFGLWFMLFAGGGGSMNSSGGA